MAPVYEPKTRDTLRQYSKLPRERREHRRISSLAEYRTMPAKSLLVDGDAAWWQYATAMFAKGELDLAEQRALSRASGAAGNFLVPTDLEAMIVSAARAQSAIAQLASEYTTTTGDTVTVPVASAHGTAAHTAENAGVTPSDETFAEVPLAAHKCVTKTIASSELARDEEARFDTYLGDELGRRIGLIQGNAFGTGSGSGQAQGVVSTGSTFPVVNAATGSATAYKLADLTTVYKALPAAYRARAEWVMHGDDFASLAALSDSSGGLVLPSLQSRAPSLFGRPVHVDTFLAAPAASAKSLVLADWKLAYAIRRVSGVSVQRLDELHSDNDQLGYRALQRYDGRVLLADAARVLAHSAT